MAAQKYKITLVLTDPASDQGTHICHAKQWANWHNVLGSDGNALNENTHRGPKGYGTYNNFIYWHVYGDLKDVLAMCNRWAGGADSYGGKDYPAFTPTVQVQLPIVPEQ
jgi:hypothetical protein